ncbi:MAG: HAD-IIB family hydrolase [Clostridia bacterium]|nr:HAD-IIB family hydrolase [Clostridia bacterium]
MKIIGSDYDGTLNHGGIDETKKSAIAKWRKAGNIFSVISGRCVKEILEIYNEKQFGCDYLIAANGAVILKPDGEIITETRCESDIARPLLETLFSSGCEFAHVQSDIHFRVYADEKTAKEKEGYTLFNMPEISYFNQISTMLETPDESEEVTAVVAEKFGEFLNPLQNGRCIDIVRHDMNKAKGLYLLADLVKADYGDIIAVGDNINDLDMIREFRSYAMENGVDSVKEAATYITEGVTELIEKEL